MKIQRKNRIAEKRNARGMTQLELADAVGAHWITISKLERGRIKLTTDWLEKLAKPLGVVPSDLLAGEVGFFSSIASRLAARPIKRLSDPKKFPVDEGPVQLTIDSPAYEPLLRVGDTLELIPWRALTAGQRQRIQGRLCFCDAGTKSGLGFLYSGKKSKTHDLFWLGGRVVEGASAISIFLAEKIVFELARP